MGWLSRKECMVKKKRWDVIREFQSPVQSKVSGSTNKSPALAGQSEAQSCRVQPHTSMR